MRRREFLYYAAAATAAFGQSKLSHTDRVDRALRGSDVDRPPFSFWHHFGLKDAETHAKRTLQFHNDYRTDIVKVMSDFAYPKPAGKWYELKVETNPFPQQLKSLELIRDGLGGRAYFIETVFNPWNVAEKLSSKEEVRKLKKDNPTALLNALDVITQSEIHHAKRAMQTGASGILLSIANANAKELTREDYVKFSRPFDKRIADALADSKLTFLHLHVEPSYLDVFKDFKFPVMNYSHRVSGISIADMRKHTKAVIAGGIDEVDYRKSSEEDLKRQWKAAQSAAGSKFILTPGCSVPDDSSAAELARLPRVVGA
jgi:uroporphyrinogen-III decarboxylase